MSGIHITGASGAGTTTLGGALAAHLGALHLDTDEFYWLPTAKKFSEKRPIPERLQMIEAEMDAAGARGWVLSGGIGEWGAPLIPRFDLVVFVYTPTEIRLPRLRARESKVFGPENVAPGGPLHEEHEEFIRWAAGYDSGETQGRSLPYHEEWLAKLHCPVVRVSGVEAMDVNVEKVMRAI